MKSKKNQIKTLKKEVQEIKQLLDEFLKENKQKKTNQKNSSRQQSDGG